MMPRIVTLTTDFGLQDEYVGVMKGVILTRAPNAIIIDLSHTIERQNILQAALLIKSAYRFFPRSTIHLVVVDPGVGSTRKMILLQACGQIFLGPDNGVLGLFLGAKDFEAAYELQCRQYYMKPVIGTFHGRDILAPVAAQIVAGLDPADVGPAVEPDVLEKSTVAAPITDREQGVIRGEVLGWDHFGNLYTNISEAELHALYGKERTAIAVKIKGTVIKGLQGAYVDKLPGELLALVGSRGFLEIAVRQGNAADLLMAETGDEITLEKISV